jgi:GT2 family glycosyltransferase
MALITAIAYDVEKNLGRAYREIVARLQPEDHVVFLDHDAIWTTRDWYKILLQAIERYPDAGLFGAMTNRIGNKEQIPPGAPAGHDLLVHRKFGLELQQRHGTDAVDITGKHLLSGVVMCFTAPVLKNLIFSDGFFGVDNNAHRDVRSLGKRVYLLKGLYVQHLYRADGIGHVGAPKAQRR